MNKVGLKNQNRSLYFLKEVTNVNFGDVKIPGINILPNMKEGKVLYVNKRKTAWGWNKDAKTQPIQAQTDIRKYAPKVRCRGGSRLPFTNTTRYQTHGTASYHCGSSSTGPTRVVSRVREPQCSSFLLFYCSQYIRSLINEERQQRIEKIGKDKTTTKEGTGHPMLLSDSNTT